MANLEQRSEARLMRETIALALFCLLMTVLSLAALVWAVGEALVDRLPSEILNLDGLLLAAICLLLATVFGFCFAWLARDARLWEWMKNRGRAVPAPSEANGPSGSTETNGK